MWWASPFPRPSPSLSPGPCASSPGPCQSVSPSPVASPFLRPDLTSNSINPSYHLNTTITSTVRFALWLFGGALFYRGIGPGIAKEPGLGPGLGLGLDLGLPNVVMSWWHDDRIQEPGIVVKPSLTSTTSSSSPSSTTPPLLPSSHRAYIQRILALKTNIPPSHATSHHSGTYTTTLSTLSIIITNEPLPLRMSCPVLP